MHFCFQAMTAQMPFLGGGLWKKPVRWGAVLVGTSAGGSSVFELLSILSRFNVSVPYIGLADPAFSQGKKNPAHKTDFRLSRTYAPAGAARVRDKMNYHRNIDLPSEEEHYGPINGFKDFPLGTKNDASDTAHKAAFTAAHLRIRADLDRLESTFVV
jgi:hypothetical protein